MRKIVYTYGVFDMVHPGHVRILNRAKELGDYLIVGVVADDAVEELKGLGRPVQSLADRMEIVKEFKCVDKVVEQETYDPAINILKIQPDVLTKGDDWDYIPGQDMMHEIHGEFISLPYSQDFSSTKIIERIKCL